MSFIDELKKLTHPYEDEDEEFEDFEDDPRRDAFEDRRSKIEDRRNKVVNIHATTQLKVVLVKPEIGRGAESGVYQQGCGPASD